MSICGSSWHWTALVGGFLALSLFLSSASSRGLFAAFYQTYSRFEAAILEGVVSKDSCISIYAGTKHKSLLVVVCSLLGVFKCSFVAETQETTQLIL